MQNSDEISLYDLWLIVAKRKKLFLAVFVVVLVVGIVFAFHRPIKYKYTQAVQIAIYMNKNGDVKPFIASKAAIDKMQNIYLPVALAQYKAKYPNRAKFVSGGGIDISDMNAGSSDMGLISLSVQSGVKYKAYYQDLFTDILKLLQQDTNVLVQRQQIYLDETLKSLQRQLKAQEMVSQGLQRSMSQKGGDPALVTQQAIFSASQAAATVQLIQSVSNIKNQLNNLKPSGFVSSFVRSDNTIGISRNLAIILSIIVGLILSFIMVFMVEFISSIKERGSDD